MKKHCLVSAAAAAPVVDVPPSPHAANQAKPHLQFAGYRDHLLTLVALASLSSSAWSQPVSPNSSTNSSNLDKRSSQVAPANIKFLSASWRELAEQAEARGDYKEAAQAWRKSAEVFGQQKDAPSQALALFYCGKCLARTQNAREAIQACQESLKLYQSLKEIQGVHLCHMQMGNIYRDRGLLEKSDTRQIELLNQAEEQYAQAIKVVSPGEHRLRWQEACEALGQIQECRHRWVEATDTYQRLLPTLEEDSSKRLPEIYARLAALHQLQDRNSRAQDAYLKAIDGFIQQGRLAEAASERSRLSRNLLNSKKFQIAEQEYSILLDGLERAINSGAPEYILKEIRYLRGPSLANRGYCREMQGQVEAAASDYLLSQKWFEERGDSSQADTLLLRRLTLQWKNGGAAAVDSELQLRIEGKPNGAKLANQFYTGLNQFDKAAQLERRELERLLAAPQTDGFAIDSCRLRLGQVLLRSQQFEPARQALEPLKQREADPQWSDQPLLLWVDARLTLAETYLAQNLPRQALPLLQSCTPFLNRLAPPQQMIVLNNLASGYMDSGQPAQALQIFTQAEKIGQRLTNGPRAYGTVLNSLGELHLTLGHNEEAVRYLRAALPIRLQTGDRRGEMVTRLNLGCAYGSLKYFKEADQFLNEAKKMAEEQGDQGIVAVTLLDQATLLLRHSLEALPKADIDRAAILLDQSLQIAKKFGLPYLQGDALCSQAQVALQRGDMAAAAKYCEQSQKLVGTDQSLSALNRYWTWLHVLAIQGRFEELDKKVPQILEVLQDKLDQLPASKNAKILESFAPLQRLCLSNSVLTGDSQQVLEREESFRALKILTLASQATLDSPAIPEDLRHRLEMLRQRLADISNSPQTAGQSSESALKREYRRALDEVESYHQTSGRLLKAKPATLAQLRQHLRVDQALVEYVQVAWPQTMPGSSGNRAALKNWYFAVILTHKGIFLEPIGLQVETDRLVRKAAAVLSTPPTSPSQGTARTSWQLPLQEASARVWGPVQRRLTAQDIPLQRMVIVPSGALFQLSFPALYSSPGEFLGDRYLLQVASSATGWLQTPTDRSPNKESLSLAFGNISPEWVPQWDSQRNGSKTRSSELTALPASLKEVELVRSLFPGEILSEQQLLSKTLASKVKNRRLLHFATHGILDPVEPLLGGLATHDGLLTLADIFRWKLDADLTVLSACNSGRSNVAVENSGDEWMSLSKAFEVAGSRSLVASMWSISDDATAEWMDQFYRQLRQGATVGEASRTAAISVRRQHPHPFYWAAFQVWGQGDMRLVGPGIEQK